MWMVWERGTNAQLPFYIIMYAREMEYLRGEVSVRNSYIDIWLRG